MSYKPSIQISTEKASANGYASLDSGSKVPLIQLPPFGPSGVGHSAGILPDPGTDDGILRSFREDGLWVAAPFTLIRTASQNQTATTGGLTYDRGHLFFITGLLNITTIGTSGNFVLNISWLDDTNTTQTKNLLTQSITSLTSGPVGFSNVFATKNAGLGDFSWTVTYSGTKGSVALNWYLGVKDISP